MQALSSSKLTRKQRDSIFAFLCVLPVLIGLCFVVFAPIVKALWMSFYRYKISSTATPKWNNFENYKKLFVSNEFFTYLWNTIVFIVGVVATQLVIAFCMALLLNTNVKGKKFFRGLFMVPWTIPSVVTALLWSWLLQPQYGVLNYIFYHLGLQGDLNKLWVQSPNLAMGSVIVASVWRQTPYMMIMLLAGLQSISPDLIEAAEIDGASQVSVFKNVILPSIRPVLDTSLVVAVINNSQMFTIIYNMTAGGPMTRTTTISVAAYKKAFISFDFGQGSALGMLWLVILGSCVFLYKRYSDKHLSSYL
jgi:multiple sugar transport system permease protein